MKKFNLNWNEEVTYYIKIIKNNCKLQVKPKPHLEYAV